MPGASSSVSLTLHLRPWDPLLPCTHRRVQHIVSLNSDSTAPGRHPEARAEAPEQAPALSLRRCHHHRFTRPSSRLGQSCPRGHWVTSGDICAVTLGAPGIDGVGPETTGPDVPRAEAPSPLYPGTAMQRPGGTSRCGPVCPSRPLSPPPPCDCLHTCRPGSHQGCPEQAAPAGTWLSVSPATRAFQVSR